MNNNVKFVDYFRYCASCEHWNKQENEDPCNECLSLPAREDSHKPEYYKKSSDRSDREDPGYFKKIKKIKDYLYEVKYDYLDYANAKHYYKTLSATSKNVPFGNCSSVRSGNFYGRNFDWTYSNQAEFLVRIPRIGNRYSSIGIAGGFSKLTDAFVNSKERDDLYRIVPFQMQDGINECGLVVSTNVVPDDYSGYIPSTPEKSKKETICGLMLVRYILDHFNNAIDAVNYICSYVSVYFPKSLYRMGYEMHFMVSDRYNNTYALEFINGQAKAIDISSNPFLTNFHIWNVRLNPDGRIYTPETQDAKHNAMITNVITPNGSGLERWNYIRENEATADSKNGMRTLLDGLKYTKAYITSEEPSNPYWYTEFVGIDNLTVVSTPSEYAQTVSKAGQLYLDRSRDEENIWQTVHSVIYDIGSEIPTMYLITQEDGKELTFKLE